MDSPTKLLNRLTDVLPLFENAVSSTTVADPDWEFAKRLKANITLLMQAVENLKPQIGVGSEKESRVALQKISEGLDRLVPRVAVTSFAQLRFPGLEALRKSTTPASLLPRFTRESHRHLVEDIANWTISIGELIPRNRERKRPSHDVHDIAALLHATIQKSLESLSCSCSHPHEGLLFMANHQSFSSAKDKDIRFDMMFTAPLSMGSRWCDSQVKVPVSTHEGLKPMLKTDSELVEHNNRLEVKVASQIHPPVASICSYLTRYRRLPTVRVALLADNGGLWPDSARGKVRFQAEQLLSPRILSFREFLKTFHEADLSLEVSTQIAILLATSFLHHYGGPWIPSKLDKDQLHFILTSKGPLLIPFLRFIPTDSYSSSLNSDSDGTARPHRLEYTSSQAARIELGVLLLELFQQKILEVVPSESEQDGLSSELLEAVFEADEMLESFKNDEQYQLIVNAIDACLDISRDPLCGESEEYEFFYQSVIRPLEDQLVKLTNGVSQLEALDSIVLQGSTAQLNISTYAGSLSALEDTLQDTSQVKLSNSEKTAKDSELPTIPTEARNLLAAPYASSSPNSMPSKSSLIFSTENSPIFELAAEPTSMQIQTRMRSTQESPRSVEYIKYLNFLVGQLQESKKREQRDRYKTAKDAATWLQEFIKIDARVWKPLFLQRPIRKPIQVAVLDTGCDLGTGFFSAMHNSEDVKRVNDSQWMDFLESGIPRPLDEDGHGTNITTTLLMLLPRAEIFVGRVARKRTDFESPKVWPIVAKAILHAAKVWKANIIILSFGFRNRPREIENAIDQASDLRNKRLIFIAAANNEGLNECERFPASYNRVISARGTSAHGGFLTEFNPAGDGQPIYGTLARDVPCNHIFANKVCKVSTMSGCSISAPILGAIAATYLQYVRWKMESVEEAKSTPLRDLDRLFEMDGMLALFSRIKVPGETIGRTYLNPWQFFKLDEHPKNEQELLCCDNIWSMRVGAALDDLQKRV